MEFEFYPEEYKGGCKKEYQLSRLRVYIKKTEDLNHVILLPAKLEKIFKKAGINTLNDLERFLE